MTLSTVGVCGCGCGQPTKIATKTNPQRRMVKGQPLRFIQGHNARTPRHAGRPQIGAGRVCERVECGKVLVRRPRDSDAEFLDRKFCSRDCYFAWKAIHGHLPTRPTKPAPLMLGELEWARAAACVGADPERFFTDKVDDLDTVREAAREFCARCPVRARCLDAAVRCQDIGVRGGWLRHRVAGSREWQMIPLLPARGRAA